MSVEKVVQFLLDMWSNKTTRNNLLILLVVVIIFVVGVLQLSTEDDSSPCSPNNFPGGCYSIDRLSCESAWANMEESCKAKVKGMIMHGRVGGPILLKCQEASFDKTFRYMRKSKPSCNDRISAVELWLKSNPDFP